MGFIGGGSIVKRPEGPEGTATAVGSDPATIEAAHHIPAS
jgi:hypothetical protein